MDLKKGSSGVLIAGNPSGDEVEYSLLRHEFESRGLPLTYLCLDGTASIFQSEVDRLETDVPPVFVGYSWGCWALLHLLELRPELKSVPCVLINPFVVGGSKLPEWFVRMMSSASFGKLLRPKITGMALQHIGRSFHPRPLAGIPEDFHKMATDVEVWQAAIRRKNFMGKHPLTVIDGASMKSLVLVGGEDQVSPAEAHLAALKKFGFTNIVEFSDAGHSLPWTHPIEVGDAVMSFLAQARKTVESDMKESQP